MRAEKLCIMFQIMALDAEERHNYLYGHTDIHNQNGNYAYIYTSLKLAFLKYTQLQH